MPPLDCDAIADLYQCAKSIVTYAGVLDKWLNGGPDEFVNLGGVQVPTLRNLASQIDKKQSQAAQAAIDQAIQDIGEVRNKIVQLEADIRSYVGSIQSIYATTLTAGESATAKVTEKGLELGIPAGPKGDRGPEGPVGKAPTLDVIDCGGAASEWVSVLDGGNAATVYP